MNKAVIASLAFLTVVAVAGAVMISQTQQVIAEETVAQDCTCPNKEFRNHGKGPMLENEASVLGLSEEELEAKLEEGMTFVEIAEEQGLTLTEIQDKIMAEKEEWLQARVDSGFLTQEQADQMKQNIEEQMEEGMLPGFGPGMGLGKGMHRGGLPF